MKLDREQTTLGMPGQSELIFVQADSFKIGKHATGLQAYQ